MMAADYRHIGGRENRLGRHYSRFSPFWPPPALAGQSLALRKLCDAGSNRRSRVSPWNQRTYSKADVSVDRKEARPARSGRFGSDPCAQRQRLRPQRKPARPLSTTLVRKEVAPDLSVETDHVQASRSGRGADCRDRSSY